MRRPEIKFLYQGLKRTAQVENGTPISTQILRHLGSSITQGFPHVNSVELPNSPLKKETNGHIPDATNDNHQQAVFKKE